MYPTKVVVREVQSDSGFQVRQLLAERIGEPRRAPELHPHSEILPFYKAGRNVPRIRIASPHLGYNLDDWAWGVPPGGIVLPIVAKVTVCKVGPNWAHVGEYESPLESSTGLVRSANARSIAPQGSR